MHNLAPLPIIPIQNIPITKVWSGFQSDKTEWSATGSSLERNPIDLPYLDAFFWSGIPILNKTPHFHLYQISKHCIQIHMNTNQQYILKKLPWNSLHLLFSHWIRYKLYPIPLVVDSMQNILTQFELNIWLLWCVEFWWCWDWDRCWLWLFSCP